MTFDYETLLSKNTSKLQVKLCFERLREGEVPSIIKKKGSDSEIRSEIYAVHGVS